MGSDRYFSSGHVFHFYFHEIVPIKRMDNFYSHFYSHKICFHFYSHEIVPIKRILGWIMVNNFGINSLMSNPLTWLGSRMGIFHGNNFSLEKVKSCQQRVKILVLVSGPAWLHVFFPRFSCFWFFRHLLIVEIFSHLRPSREKSFRNYSLFFRIFWTFQIMILSGLEMHKKSMCSHRWDALFSWWMIPKLLTHYMSETHIAGLISS